jgi:hypothetical protein
MKIDTRKIVDWKRATKTKPVKAKPLVNLLIDKAVVNKFLVNTLEGNEPLGDGVVICVGEAGDVWQQTPKKLLQKYNVTSIDNDGWMVCEPRPDNSVKCFQVLNALTLPCAVVPPDEGMYKAHDFYIHGLWGTTDPDFFGKNVQWGDNGDYVCQSESDESDVWIVKKKIFENTYQIL